MTNQIEIYQDKEGTTHINVQFEQETVWLTQAQMAMLFDTTPQNITMHLKGIFQEKELEKEATCKDFLQVRQEGSRTVKRKQLHYNLDAILSVGYRIKSVRATQFRIWATQRLKDYLIQGYAINKKRLAEKEQEVQVLKGGIQILSKAIEQASAEGNSELFSLFSKGLALLDDYDHETLDTKGKIDTVIYPSEKEYMEMIQEMYSDFESDVFAQPKDESFSSSIAQIQQTFDGVELYPSLEVKAANLLYLIVKNHSFVDGNKRIAAACFLYFLNQNNHLIINGKKIISNEALASLTLFVATSKPEQSEIVKRLILSILNRNLIN